MSKNYSTLPPTGILEEVIISNLRPKFLSIKEGYFKFNHLTSDMAIEQILKETNNNLRAALIECPDKAFSTITQSGGFNLSDNNPIFSIEEIIMDDVIFELFMHLKTSGLYDSIKEKIESAIKHGESVVIPVDRYRPNNILETSGNKEKASDDYIDFEISIQNEELTGNLIKGKCDMFNEAPNVIATYLILTRAFAKIFGLNAVMFDFIFHSPYICASDIEQIQNQLNQRERYQPRLSTTSAIKNAQSISINPTKVYMKRIGIHTYPKNEEECA